MAVHVIAGVMGSGKSFESVREKILPALRAGQRVVSNIHGLNHQAIADHLALPLADVQRLLLVVSDEQVLDDDTFYPAGPDDLSSVVHPGDLVVLDEVWRFFKRGQQLSLRCMSFFRMHRHWSSAETGLTTEIVLCIQSIRGLHQDIRDVVELRFQCRKMKILGQPDRYQVWLYEGDERKASHHFARTYDPAIFPLYKSHAKAGAVEQVDKRQSIFNQPFFRIVLPIFALLIPLGCWLAYKSLNKLTGGAAAAAPSASAASAPPSPPPGFPPIGQAPGQAPAAPLASSAGWRIVASYRAGPLPVLLLVDEKGRYRTITPGSLSTGAGGELYAPVPPETSQATTWAGPAATYTAQQPANTGMSLPR